MERGEIPRSEGCEFGDWKGSLVPHIVRGKGLTARTLGTKIPHVSQDGKQFTLKGTRRRTLDFSGAALEAGRQWNNDNNSEG